MSSRPPSNRTTTGAAFSRRKSPTVALSRESSIEPRAVRGSASSPCAVACPSTEARKPAGGPPGQSRAASSIFRSAVAW